jgi:hypothetical protein
VAEPMPAVVGIPQAAAGCARTRRGGSFFRNREAGGWRRLAWPADRRVLGINSSYEMGCVSLRGIRNGALLVQ